MSNNPKDKIAKAIESGEVQSAEANNDTPAPLSTSGKKSSQNSKNVKKADFNTSKVDNYIGKDGKKSKKPRRTNAQIAVDDKRKAEAELLKETQDEAADKKAEKAEKKRHKPQYNVVMQAIHGHDAGFFLDEDGNKNYWKADKWGLPTDCPVKPLGKSGDVCFYLDANNQVAELKAQHHSRNNISHLFGAYNQSLEMWWPAVRKSVKADFTENEWIKTGWKVQGTVDLLMNACARKGIWNALNKVRGNGAWTDEDGNLIYHCGDKIWSLDGAESPGEYDGYIYPTSTKLPAPWAEEVTAKDCPAHDLLALFETWSWERPRLDPLLLIGWLGASLLSGALDWRPMMFITGDKASGKSTIHKIVKNLFGDGILSTADTTPAGIYQQVGHGCLPIAVDELENSDRNNNARTIGIIKLARLASSGSVMLRGGADHKGTEFQCRSCFMFSAILMPPMSAQDKSRMAILELGHLKKGQTLPKLDPKVFKEYGQKLKRRMIYKWPLFQEILEHFRGAMTKAGHDGRSIDQFGTLIAAAYVLLSDKMPGEKATAEMMKLVAPNMLNEITNNDADADSCLNSLLQSNIGRWRSGADKSIAALLEMYVYRDDADLNRVPDDVKKGLVAVGLTINKGLDAQGIGSIEYLNVPIRHRQTMELFNDSNWSGRSDTDGGWSQALGRLPGAIKNRQVRIEGINLKCVSVPLMHIYRENKDALEKLEGVKDGFSEAEKATANGIDPDPFAQFDKV